MDLFDDPVTQTMARFIREIGLAVEPATLSAPTLLPGIAVAGGVLRVDPVRLQWPGDLLHEAGHLAVCDPALRPTLDAVSDSPAEEMSALAWSYAAAIHLGLEPAVVFHPAGYRGGAASLIDAFETGGEIGVPMLQLWGMTLGRRTAAAEGAAPFPHMLRWLR